MMISQSSSTKFLNDRAAAEIMGLQVQTLRNWRCSRKGPSYVKAGRAVRYDITDVMSFMQSRRVELESSKPRFGKVGC